MRPRRTLQEELILSKSRGHRHSMASTRASSQIVTAGTSHRGGGSDFEVSYNSLILFVNGSSNPS
jgi:hypothetical protein